MCRVEKETKVWIMQFREIYKTGRIRYLRLIRWILITPSSPRPSLHSHARFSTSLNPRISLFNAYISLVPTSLSIYPRIPFLPPPFPAYLSPRPIPSNFDIHLSFPLLLPQAHPPRRIGQVPLSSIPTSSPRTHTLPLSLSLSLSLLSFLVLTRGFVSLFVLKLCFCFSSPSFSYLMEYPQTKFTQATSDLIAVRDCVC